MGDGFAWTIPLIQAGIGLLLLAARHAGAGREAGCWGRGYLLAAAALAVPATDALVPTRLVAVTADTLFALAFHQFAGALLFRYRGGDLPVLRGMLLAVGILLPAIGVLAIGTLHAELVASDLTCAAQLGAALLLVRVWPASWVDRALIAVSWLVVVENVARGASAPFLIADAGLSGFLDTSYSYVMYADAMLSGFSSGLLALVAVTRDIVAGYRREAHADPLTGLLNRRGLEAVAASRRDGRIDCAVSCDLDFFKRVNDRFGHDAGDRVLVAFAGLAREALPPGGVAARIGGEEFVLYLPGHGPDLARAAAERLRRAMAAHDWFAAGLPWRQTASFGVAMRASPDEPLDALLRRADRQLYLAKREGRDQVRELLAA